MIQHHFGLCNKIETPVYSYLDELIPTSRDDHRVRRVRAETNARNPLGVALVGDGILAVTESVPELDGLVARAGDNLAVVGGEGDGQDIAGVADEPAGGLAAGEFPETEGLVPGRGEGVGTVRRDDTVGDDVGVAGQTPLGDTIASLVTGAVQHRQKMVIFSSRRTYVGRSQVPDDQGLVAGTRQEHVRVLEGGSQALQNSCQCRF